MYPDVARCKIGTVPPVVHSRRAIKSPHNLQSAHGKFVICLDAVLFKPQAVRFSLHCYIWCRI